MTYNSDLVDIPTMQKLADSFNKAFGIPLSLVADDDATVLSSSGGLEVCRNFYRKNPETVKACSSCDSCLFEHRARGSVSAVTRCPHGMLNAATAIKVDGDHIVTLFAGPFLHHRPDQMEREYLRQQAQRFGFEETAYLNALANVPVIPEERIRPILDFLTFFAEMIAGTGLADLNLLRSASPLCQVGGRLQIGDEGSNAVNNELRHLLSITQILLDAIPAAVYHKDAEGRFQGCNKMFSDFILGLPKEKIIGRSMKDLADVIPADLVPIYHEKDQELKESGGTQSYEAPVQCADGKRRDMLFHKAIFRKSNGRIAGIIGVMVNISERKQTERMLLENEQRLAQIIKGNSIATFVIDREHIITHWNRACENLLEFSASEMIGTRWQWMPFYLEARPVLADMVLDRTPMEKIFQNYAQCTPSAIADEAYECEGYFPHLGTMGKWLFFTAAPLKDTKGNIIGAIETLQDISANKETREILKKARTLAEDASRAKSEFLAAMSHEIRTPMNAIIGMTALMQETILTPEQQRYLRVVQAASEHLLILIDDVLDLSKIEVNKLELREGPLNLRELVVDTVAMFAYQAELKGVKTSFSVDNDVPVYIYGDTQRLRQVLVNLIGNALKFTDQGWVEINVRLIADKDSKQDDSLPQAPQSSVTLLFSVQDTGVGIPASEQNIIFDSFTQLDGSFRKRNGGVGLGLAITKQLVTMMGGKIWVESRPGWGSMFSFTVHLPSVPLHELETMKQRETDEREAIYRPLRILLVDDLAVNVEIITTILEKRGHTVRGVFNGRDALKALQHERFDLVLMDVQMPVMDGIEAVRRIRALDDRQIAAVPVIALTAHAVKGDRERFLKAGMNAYISKPVQLKELIRVIGVVVQGKEQSSPDAGMSAARAIDLDYALALMDGDKEVLRLGCEVILRELPQLLRQLDDSLQSGDDCTMNRLAHSIKSVAKSIKADETAAFAEQVERLASEKRIEDVSRVWPNFRESAERMLTELKTELPKRLA